MEVRESAPSLRNERTRSDVECARHWWAIIKDKHPNLGDESLAAMEAAKCDGPAEKVRPYIVEVKHALSVIRVSDQILNMDGTGFCSR
jgi:hypothetical protein